MKKGKVITLSRVAVVGMVVLLGAAIWLNTKYAGGKTKYMGETTLVSNQEESEALPTAAEVEVDYFTEAAQNRDKAYNEAKETAEELLYDVTADDTARNDAAARLSELLEQRVSETAAENILTAKGFSKSLVIISDEVVTVVVQSEGLTAAQTVQIQDAVMSSCGATLNNIKIVTVNG